MDFYEYWSNYYTTQKSYNNDEESLRGVISELIQKGYMVYDVIVDGIHKKKMLIYEHIDPIEGKQNDFRAICLDRDNIHWGNIISLEDGREYMAITRGDWNGAYHKYRIRELTDDITFTKDTPVKMKCIMANKGFYDETSFVNEQNVFEDKELRAALIQYNANTKNLTLFDDVCINDEHYRIVKIDNYTFKEYDEEFGVLQLVLIDTPFGKIVKNDSQSEIKGVVMSAMVKDKILNSISRELLCEHNEVQRGDYIDFTYRRDEKGTKVMDTYLMVNRPTMGKKYDISLMYLCENTIKLLNDVGEVVDVHAYYENNRVRIDKITENEFIKLKNSSYLIMIQQNEFTNRLRNKVNRIMINGEVYKITGYDPFTEGILALGLELDQVSTDDNVELGVANYYSKMEELKPKPPIATDIQIVEANGETTLCKGFENEYYLKGVSEDVTWGVDKSWVTIRQDGNRCWIKFDELKRVGETVILSAEVTGKTYRTSIKCTKL